MLRCYRCHAEQPFAGPQAGEELRQFCQMAGLSAAQFARDVGISPSLVSFVECGKRRFSLRTLDRVLAMYSKWLREAKRKTGATGTRRLSAIRAARVVSCR